MCTRRVVFAVVASIALVFVASCGPATVSRPAAQDQPASETVAPIAPSPVPTELPPSAVPTEAPSVEPTPTYTPEIIATRPEDIAGVWLVKRFSNPLSNAVFAADLTFREDGTVSFDDIDSGMHIFSAILRFEDGKVIIDSDECWDVAKGVFYHCEIPFIIYSQSQSGVPVRIRFEKAGGKGVFIDNIGGRALLLDKR
jgi:hypothetical protein